MQKKANAFSLVELSIVLVILGLLTGGILAGQSLIRAAELRAVSTEYSRYVTATQSFRDKYFALPGDFTLATKFWGLADASDCTGTTTGTIATCNGNGNGIIDNSDPSNPTSNERFRAWQHLASAGLIEGTYSGISLSRDYGAGPSNSPSSRISGGLWYMYGIGRVSGGTSSAPGSYLFDGNYGNSLLVGGDLSSAFPVGPLMKPAEAWNLDTKMDDGQPIRGKVWAIYDNGTDTNCTNAASIAPATAAYNLSINALECALVFNNQF